MERQFKVINRVSRKEQVFNSEEVARFFKLNSIKEYAISTIKPTEDILETFVISTIAVASVILITKLILQWIII